MNALMYSSNFACLSLALFTFGAVVCNGNTHGENQFLRAMQTTQCMYQCHCNTENKGNCDMKSCEWSCDCTGGNCSNMNDCWVSKSIMEIEVIVMHA